MQFELHCHSCYSVGTKVPTEGIPRPEEIIKRAKAIDLAGIAITDHRTTKAWPAAAKEAKRQGVIFIPGVELQTDAGHLIALGINELVPNLLPVEESVERIHQQGGIAVAPHPFDIKGDGIGGLGIYADAIEVFNSLSIEKVNNRFALSRFGHKHIAKVVGSDAHTLGMIGLSVNIMEAHDVDSVLKCILKGKVSYAARYVPMDELMSWVRLRLSGSQAEILRYTSLNYSPPKRWLYKKMLKKFLSTSDTPWRVLAEMSLMAVKAYGVARILTY